MTAILEIIRQVMGEAGFNVPQTVATNSDTDQRQVLALANRSAATLSRYDWQLLRREATIDLVADDQGGGTYSLPSDFRLYRPDTAYRDASVQHVDLPVSDSYWAYLKANNSPAGVYLKARFEGGQLSIHDPGALAGEIRFEYISAHPIFAANGVTGKPRFTADDDIWRLDRDLIEMDLLWRWKKAKGIDDWDIDRADFLTYERRLKFDDSGSKTLIDGAEHEVVQGDPMSPQANLYVN